MSHGEIGFIKHSIVAISLFADSEAAPFVINAEAGDDVDEPRDLNRLGFRFEWYCMLEGETSPLSADQTNPFSGLSTGD